MKETEKRLHEIIDSYDAKIAEWNIQLVDLEDQIVRLCLAYGLDVANIEDAEARTANNYMMWEAERDDTFRYLDLIGKYYDLLYMRDHLEEACIKTVSVLEELSRIS